MRVVTSQHIKKPSSAVFDTISDFGLWVKAVDPDVVSMDREGEGPIGVDSRWLEVLKVPGSTAKVDLWISAIKPGKSIDVEFDNKMMKGKGTFTVSSSEGGTDVGMDVTASIKPGLGWLFYPMIRMDFPKRERNRMATLKIMMESGKLAAKTAEPAAGAPAG